MLRIIEFIIIVALLIQGTACGTDPEPLTDAAADADISGDSGPDGAPDQCGPPRTAVVVTTDYTTGGAALVDLTTRTSQPDLLTLHSDAVVRCPCGRPAVIERRGGDNLALLNPIDGGLELSAQWSLGVGSNPQDALFFGDRAYLSLLDSGEVVAMDLRSGAVVERVDLGALADDDGEPEPSAMVEHDGRLVVALQMLDRDTPLWDPTGPAQLVVLRRDPLALETTIELVGANPVTPFVLGPEPGTALLGHAGEWSDPTDGGIELIDLVEERSRGLIVEGDALGGSVVDFVIVNHELAYASVSVAGVEDRLVSFNPSTGELVEQLAVGPPYSLVRLMLDQQDGRNQLLVVVRDPAAPGVRFFDALDGTELTEAPVPTGLPPFDLCLLSKPRDQQEGDAGVDDAGSDADSQECELEWDAPSPFIDGVVEFLPADGASFGADRMPEVVFGPPLGGGQGAGSMDVVSLGCGGSITVGLSSPPILDRPGPDFVVFENPFGPEGGVFIEPAQVWVSNDGENFVQIPCDPVTGEGCAGLNPVFSHPDNCLDPTDPEAAGGDAFDLATVGLTEARWIRLVDRSAENADAAFWCGASSSGFDLDAISVVAAE